MTMKEDEGTGPLPSAKNRRLASQGARTKSRATAVTSGSVA